MQCAILLLYFSLSSCLSVRPPGKCQYSVETTVRIVRRIPRKQEIAYKASVGQSFTLGSEVVRCVSGDSHRACRTENNVNRQKVNFNRRKVFGPVSDATLKSGSEVNEGHWKWYDSIDCVWFNISVLRRAVKREKNSNATWFGKWWWLWHWNGQSRTEKDEEWMS